MTPIQPTNGYIHIQLNIPKDNLVIVPDKVDRISIGGTGEDASNFIEVLSVDPAISDICKGDHVLLRPDCNFMPYSNEPKTALVHYSSIIGIYSKQQAAALN